jgi:putative serine/threonine protein kinase
MFIFSQYKIKLARGLALALRIERLDEEPYASIICYPRSDSAELGKRLKELRKLGVEALEFCGGKEAFGIPVLGKGCVGIVTIAYRNGEKVALKIRRVDADRDKMQMEAKMLQKANSASVGPRLLGVSKNFLLMQFIEGDLLPDWLERKGGKALIKRVLRDVLEQCWRLDSAGLDHGELSHAPKHVIVDGKNLPFIVDFESASLNRRPSNVTSICQFLFLSGVVAEKVTAKLGEKDGKAIVKVLRVYKADRNRGNFERVLGICGL